MPEDDERQQADAEQQAAAGPGPSSEAVAAATAATFSKRVRNRSNLRKRGNEEGADEEGDDDPTRVERKAKAARGDMLTFASGQKVDDAVTVAFEGTKAVPTGRDESVFKRLETETQTDRDGRALREAVLAQGKADGPVADDGTYKGMNSYIDYRAGFRREHTVGAEKGTGSHGPLRANMYVRMTAIMDYNPSICKDYKETGFCSYGDSCKFLHDRGDYKQSWELDRDWDEEQKRKLDERMKALERGDDEEAEGGKQEQEEDDDLPFACYICRKPWAEAKNPVVTRCQHYFCESCALKQNSKSSKCAVCDQPTQGIFNVAHAILKKMKKMQRP